MLGCSATPTLLVKYISKLACASASLLYFVCRALYNNAPAYSAIIIFSSWFKKFWFVKKINIVMKGNKPIPITKIDAHAAHSKAFCHEV